MTSSTLIGLTVHGRYDEAIASGVCTPGQILLRDTDLKVKRHNVVGGRGPVLVCKEHELEGIKGYGNPPAGVGLMDDYGVGDVVPFYHALPGDVYNCLIAAGTPAIVKSNLLMIDGNGGLIKVPTSGGDVLDSKVVDSTAITNADTNEHDFDRTVAAPANSLRAGDVVILRGQAIVTAAAGTDTSTFKLYIGTTPILVSAAVNATTGDIVDIECTLVVRTAGVSGTFVASGRIFNGASGVGASVVSGATGAINTTVANTFKVSVTWSATTATCSATLKSLSASLAGSTGLSPLFQAEDDLDLSAEDDPARLPCRVI